jgi:hypothetical protein
MNTQDLLLESFQRKIKEGNTKDTSKILQFAYEDFVLYKLKQNGIVCNFAQTNNKNDLSYDLITEDNIRIQVKGRASTTSSGRPNLHLENTRRVSGKNKGNASKSGHVSYGLDEHDIIVFVLPIDFSDVETWKCLAIPTKSLEDPKNKGRLIRNVPAGIIDTWSKYTIKQAFDMLGFKK